MSKKNITAKQYNIRNFASDMKKIIITLLLCVSGNILAQTSLDSLNEDFRTITARNFSRYRTVNMSWEMKSNHDYDFTVINPETEEPAEEGRKKNLHTLRFSAMVPLIKGKRLSLYTNIMYNSYRFDSYDRNTGTDSQIFRNNDGYDYYRGGINGTYMMQILGKPFLLSAEVAVDADKQAFGMVSGTLSAVMVIKNTRKTNISIGMAGMTLYNKIPIMPIVAYWHRFGTKWSVDITMPIQFYVRYEPSSTNRFSAGASMVAEQFYIQSDITGTENTYFYSDALLRPELCYEYIINRHLYLAARIGASMVMKGGLYSKSRKGIDTYDSSGHSTVEPQVKQTRQMQPFFNIGISYSLF